MGCGLVHELQTSVVLEDIQYGSICLPQEFEPWCNNGTVGSVSGLFSRDGGEEDRLWGFGGLEIIDILGGCGSLQSRLYLICLGLRFGNLLLCQFDETLEDELQSVSECWC